MAAEFPLPALCPRWFRKRAISVPEPFRIQRGARTDSPLLPSSLLPFVAPGTTKNPSTSESARRYIRGGLYLIRAHLTAEIFMDSDSQHQGVIEPDEVESIHHSFAVHLDHIGDPSFFTSSQLSEQIPQEPSPKFRGHRVV